MFGLLTTNFSQNHNQSSPQPFTTQHFLTNQTPSLSLCTQQGIIDTDQAKLFTSST